jgi:hypothetical protein
MDVDATFENAFTGKGGGNCDVRAQFVCDCILLSTKPLDLEMRPIKYYQNGEKVYLCICFNQGSGSWSVSKYDKICSACFPTDCHAIKELDHESLSFCQHGNDVI